MGHVEIAEGLRWRQAQCGVWAFHWAENRRNPAALPTGLRDDGGVDDGTLKAGLLGWRAFHAFIAESAEFIVAATDRVRSYPVFYSGAGTGGFRVSNAARALRDVCGLRAFDPLGVSEFQMSCWSGGARTVVAGLSQLQAGEVLIHSKATGQTRVERYYLFYSDDPLPDDEPALIDALSAIHRRMFERIVERANGRPIWLPLSGGWDSRLIAASLAETGYDNLHTFSYGVRGNHETRLARRVAETLGLPWREVRMTAKGFRDFYHSDLRRQYFDFSDGLSSLPFVQDISVLSEMRASGVLPEDAILINGQSGDFITGGHIHADQMQAYDRLEDVAHSLLAHHYRMWKTLRTPRREAAVVSALVEGLQALRHQAPTMPLNARMTECWEWQERQSKFVVNGQRAYDFFGLEWELPLWEDEYLDFWARVPLRLKVGQALYKECLRQTAYRDVFNLIPTQVWRWPGATILIVPLARAVGLVAGASAKDWLYKTFKWIGHYRYSYAAFGYGKAMREAMIIRDPDSFNIQVWSRENGLPDPAVGGEGG